MKRLSFALAALLGVGAAHAATVSFEFGLPLVESKTELNQTGQLSLFDSSLGSLTGVSLTVFGSATFLPNGTNNAARATRANFTSNTSLAWSSSIAEVSALLTEDLLLQRAIGFQNNALGERKSFGPSRQTAQFTYDLTSIAGLLTGPGSFDLNCQSFSDFTVRGGSGNIASNQKTRAGCGAQIVYTFGAVPSNQVPEPASLALVGLALAGAGVASRRRRQA